jgi:hypothetical protein
MRTFAFAVLLAAQSLVLPGLAQSIGGVSLDATGNAGPARVQTGTVTDVDSVTMNFVCRNATISRRYWVTRATRYVSDRPNASFYDLATGEPVVVMSHHSPGFDIADAIRF